MKAWASGHEGFRNILVTDEHGKIEITLGDVVETGLATYLGGVFGAADLALLGGATVLAANLVAKLKDPDFWECLYGQNIAWEYFVSQAPDEAILNEVFCGKRWIKARHLDEVFIHQQLEQAFGANPPYLILGHSHEPRHQALNPNGSIAEHYLNSGAAGRFENLIWGVEIIDGIPQVVAWHIPEGPESTEAPERRTYTPVGIGLARLLVPSSGHVPLPAFEAEPGEKARWLEPILHVMMGPRP